MLQKDNRERQSDQVKCNLPVDWCCIAAVNKPEILAANLAASPSLIQRPDLLEIQVDQPSASIAYNRGLERTGAEIVVFAHQDVYLPKGWDEILAQRVRELDSFDPDWAVAGLIGLTPDNHVCGHVWSTGLARDIGGPFDLPERTICVDELLIILRRSSGLSFDSGLPSFHLYGTDIVQSALKVGLGAYIVHAPVIHNSQPVQMLEGGYTEAYRYMQKKLADRLPITTLIADLVPGDLILDKQKEYSRLRNWRNYLSRRWRLFGKDWRWVITRPSAQSIAGRIGYEEGKE